MANEKISNLTELSAQPADGDLLPIVDISDTTDAVTGTTKKVQYSNLVKNSSATEKGVVELATQAEYDAGTATGGTGAPLMSSPATTRGKKYNDYIADAGATDAYAITVVPAITAYVAGQEFTFKANTANTGACTLNVCGLGATNIKKNVSTELETGDIVANQIVKVVYDGTNMQMVTRSGSTSSVTYVYTASDTWTKPSGITFVEVTCIGAGGGGAGGEGAAAGNSRTGGAGGGGGQISKIIMRASDLASNVSVTVGTAGTGGNGGTAGAGSNGVAGGNTSFGTYLIAYGGALGTFGAAGGAGGTNTAVTTSPANAIAGQGGAGSPSAISPVVGCSAEYGGAGAGSTSSNDTTVASAGGSSLFGGGGGGGGGSVSSVNAYRQPGAGGSYQVYTSGGGGAAGTSAATSTVGTAGTSRSGFGCGSGGGGGGGDGDSVGSVGGDGGAPGGGGGGGGGGTNVGGKGGAGGAGECRVFCW